MAAPVLTGPAARAGEFFAPWTDGPGDPAAAELFLWLAAALGRCFEHVELLVRAQPDGTPGYAILFDPEQAEDWMLPWTAMVAGARLLPGLSPAAQRELVHPDSNKRGTPGAIEAAVKTTLAGGRRVVILWRTDGAYRHTVITYTPDTPDPTATVAVLSDPLVKPTGHWFTHIVTDGWTIGEMEADYGTVGALEADFSDLAHLESRLP